MKGQANAMARQISNNVVEKTDTGLKINLRGAKPESETKIHGNDYYNEQYNNNDVMNMTEEAVAGNGQYYDANNEQDYADQHQVFLVVSKNMLVYKDENLEMEDKDNMAIEQHSTVMGQYINDYVIYIHEPYYVYVSVDDLREVDISNYDGFEWDTGVEEAQQQQVQHPPPPPHQQQQQQQPSNNRVNNKVTPQTGHYSQGQQQGQGGGYGVDDGNFYNDEDSKQATIDNRQLAGILSHVPKGGSSTPGGSPAGASSRGSGKNSPIASGNGYYHSAEISLPHGQDAAGASSLMSIDDAIASNYNNSGHGYQSAPSQNQQQRRGSRSRSRQGQGGDNFYGQGVVGNGNGNGNGGGGSNHNSRPSSARSHSSRSAKQRASSDISKVRRNYPNQQGGNFGGPNQYGNNGGYGVSSGPQNNGGHSRSQSRRSNQSHQSHHSQRSQSGGNNINGAGNGNVMQQTILNMNHNAMVTGGGQATNTMGTGGVMNESQTGTGSNESPDHNEASASRSGSRSPSRSQSRSRRGSMSSVSTFVDVNYDRPFYGGGGGGAGNDDNVDVLSGTSRDGKSVHLISKEQLKNPLYFNQIANEILAKKAVSVKDQSRTKETIVDNIIVNRFTDLRPQSGTKYFTQSRYLRDGISVLIPFTNEPANELEATLTELYYTHQFLIEKREEWRGKPFNILLVQDGWGKAHKSLQNYMKKLFPKRFFFNRAEPTDVDNNTHANAGGGINNLVDDDDYMDAYDAPVPSQRPLTPQNLNGRPNRRVKHPSRGVNGVDAGYYSDDPTWDAQNNMNGGNDSSMIIGGPLRPPLQNQQSMSQSYEIKYANEQSDIEINYDESYQGGARPPSVGGGNNNHMRRKSSMSRSSKKNKRAMSEYSVSEYAPSVAMELPKNSQYWWEYFDDFDGGYKPKQGPIMYIFEKTIDNPSYFQLKFNRNEKGRYDKKIESQLTLHITLIIKLDQRGKHNSREWFLGKCGFAEAYRSRYLMTTNAFTLFDIQCLYSLTSYLDANGDCSVVTGRQRAMSRRQQGKKYTEFKCSMNYLLRLTQTFDWELTNNVYNPCYGTVGFLPVVPGHCGLYRASDILQDKARNWYFAHVNTDPRQTGLVLGNLQHVEDRLLTYAAALKPAEFRRIGYVPEALFYIKIDTDIEEVVSKIRESIDGTFAGFLFLLYTARYNFWNWQCAYNHKMLIFSVFVANFIQLCVMFFGGAISLGMLRTSLAYLIDKYGAYTDARVNVAMLFVWLTYLLHLIIHNTNPFHHLIIKLLFLISILTSVLTTVTYLMLIFIDGTSFYDALFAEFVTEEQYQILYILIMFCLLAPFPCAVIVGGFESGLLLVKSYGAYIFSFHLMWGWISSYAIVRCWDIDYDDNDHAEEKGVIDPLNNEAAEEREKQAARFLQKSRLIMLGLIGCNVLGYMVPGVTFVAILFFMLSLAFFMVLSLFAAIARTMGIDLKFYEVCCSSAGQKANNNNGPTAVTNSNNNNNVNNDQFGNSFNHRENSVGTQSHDPPREDSNDSNDGMVIIPQQYIIETKERYDRMRANEAAQAQGQMGQGQLRTNSMPNPNGGRYSPQMQGIAPNGYAPSMHSGAQSVHSGLQMVPVGSPEAQRYSNGPAGFPRY